MIEMGRNNKSLYVYLVALSALSLQFIRGSGLQSIVIYALFSASSIFVGKVLIGDWGTKATVKKST